MKDLLLFYYNDTGSDVPLHFEEILELCELNKHLFVNAFIHEKLLRDYEVNFINAQMCTANQRDHMGLLLCGLGLYFRKLNDTYNSSVLFKLALPSSNIVALVCTNSITFMTDEMLIQYNEMKKVCIDAIRPLFLCEDASRIGLQKVFLKTILENRTILNNAIKNEKITYSAFMKCKSDTLSTIRQAIDLATYTFDFDINSFYNNDAFL